MSDELTLISSSLFSFLMAMSLATAAAAAEEEATEAVSTLLERLRLAMPLDSDTYTRDTRIMITKTGAGCAMRIRCCRLWAGN